MPGRVARQTWITYVALINANTPVSVACDRLGIDYKAAQKFNRGDQSSTGHAVWVELCQGTHLWQQFVMEAATRMPASAAPGMIAEARRPKLAIPEAAQEALGDESGRRFRERYFGRRTVYWQDDLWHQLWSRFVLGRQIRQRHFLVANMPPGAGKTTIMHDLTCRAIVEDRSIRIANFSGASALAIRNTNRVRKSLERATPQPARDIDQDAGLAVNALATLTADFGAFRPITRDMWNAQAFVVAQDDDEVVSEKEPTCSAFGFDQSYIGNRLDFVIADDMVDKRFTRNPEVLLAQREVWDDEAESRLDPGGLLVLIGQRLAADDLYHYCISQEIPFDDDELVELEIKEAPRRYTHIVYPAHDDDICQRVHKRGEALPWPEGCLLDPLRLPWKDLSATQARRPDRYEVVYQQRDSAPGSVLVDRAWIDGGIDHNGDRHSGSWDLDRSVWGRPSHLGAGPHTGIITVDPSSTRYWAIHGYLYSAPEDEKAAKDLAGPRYLLDLANLKMSAPELLGYSLETRKFYGILEQWWQNYRDLGLKLDAVVVEQNHAQRFLLQYDHATTWAKLRGVQFIPHNTANNKLDPDIGVTSIGQHWRFGRMRLPGRTEADRTAVDPLVRQVTTYSPGRSTIDDQVMANWFMEIQLPNIAQRVRRPGPTTEGRTRPSWLTGSRR